MRNWKILAIGLALSLASTAPALANDKTRDEQIADRKDVKAVEAEDADMNAAIAEAQSALPQFLELLAGADEERESAGFKFPLGGWEHIWVNDVRRDGEFLTGRLGNVPVQEGYQMGDTVRVPIKEVSDWTYTDRSGFAHGHFTTRVLLDRMPSEQANEIREALGW
jgi:uncharacterized protein YegJ (DUF2314 family)